MKWERDKKLHAIAGAVISTLAGLALVLYSQVPIALCAFLGTVAAAIIGAAKEYLYDVRYPDKHTVDRNDFIATALGGVAGAIILIVVGMFLQVSPWE